MALAVNPPRARAALVGLVLGATVVLSACNPGRPPAATVEGTEIPAQYVDDLLDAYRQADPELYDPQLDGQGEGTTQMPAFSQVLDRYVIEAAVAELADERGVIPTEEDRTEAETQLRNSLVQDQQVVSGAEDPAAAAEETEALRQEVYDAIPSETQDWLIEVGSKRVALSRELAAEAGDQEELARQAYQNDLESYTQYCIRAIQARETDLAEVQQRLADGEDFGQVSAELSVPGIVIDQAGQELAEVRGEIGCIPQAQLAQTSPLLQQSILDNPDGGVTEPEPVTDQAGVPVEPAEVFILEVSPPQVQPFEDVAAQIIESLPNAGDIALDTLLDSALPSMDITVNPRFGTWDAEAGAVVAPIGAATVAVPAEG